jgi:hypothetical protein
MKLSRDYKYPLSVTAQALLKEREQAMMLVSEHCERGLVA